MSSANADRLDMQCDEFLARHSDYVDGQLTPLAASRFTAHAEVCSTCARYDRIVRRAGVLVRDLPSVEPSDDFELRLQHRLFHEQDSAALRGRSAGTVMLGIAAALALLAWSPLVVERIGSDDIAPAVAGTSLPTTSVMDPFVEESAWYPVMPVVMQPQPSALFTAFPGPYSPLVVSPPVHRSVRAVSAEYPSID